MSETRFGKVELEHPIKRGDTEIAAFTLREPLAGEMRNLTMTDILNSDVSAMIKLVPRISDPVLTEAEVAKLRPADFTSVCSEVVAFFLSRAKRDSLGL